MTTAAAPKADSTSTTSASKWPLHLVSAASPKGSVSKLGMAVGYLKGFPWPVLPLAMGSLVKAKVTGDQRGIDNARALLEMMARGADTFCSLIWLLRGFYSISDPYKPAQYFGLDDTESPTKPRVIDLDGLQLQYGVDDFDAPERKMNAVYRALYWCLRNGPQMQATHVPLPPIEEFQAMLRETFGQTFVAYRPIEGDIDDPRIACRYMTHDYGAPWLRREGGKFVADLSHMEGLELRDPDDYEAYGGRLEFDVEMKDISITWKGVRYTPDHADWRKARYVLMSSALINVVLEIHTLQVHYLNSALFALKTRTELPKDHPIYRLLRPFTLRTVMINEHAIHSILTDSGILHHGTPMTWSSIKKLYHHAASDYRHIPVPAQLEEKGLLEADGSVAKNVAWAEESQHVYAVIDRFVRSYVDIYYEDDAAVRADAAVTSFFCEIRAGMPETAGIPSELSKAALVDLLAVFVWNVTFWHDFTSQTGNSLRDYRLGGVLIKREEKFGSFYPNFQEHMVTLLAHQLTTVEGNKVVDNFHRFWLDDRAVNVALQFQQDLWDYRAALGQRNAGRDFVFNAYDPTWIETSVQT